MSTADLYADLIRHAEACDAAAEEHAINGDTSDARADDGRSSAYRHAAELLRGAVAAAVEEERAACATVAQREGAAWREAERIDVYGYHEGIAASERIADAIRARGESPRGDAASDGREGAE